MSQHIDLIENEEVNFDTALKELITTVYDLVGNPISSWAVAATIESLGIRDIDAQTDYGYSSVFDLAEDVFKSVKEIVVTRGEKDESDEKIGGFVLSAKLFFKHYSAGLIFSLPMISQIFFILVFEYALWAWLGFNEAQATVIAFGTILSFIVTGGFIQVIGRLISKYKGEGNYYLARKSITKVLIVAVPTVLLTVVGLIAINLLLPFYPQRMMLLAMVYMVLISFLLLTAAVLFATEQRSMILFSIILGSIVVVLCMKFLHIGVYFSQWIAIIITSLSMAIYAAIYYALKIRSLRQELIKQSLPRREVTYYNSYRFFVYGLCYFSFLFVDRLMAWSTADPEPPAYIFWFDTPYELGMDWALITFVITIAMLEFSIHAFSAYIVPAQKIVSVNNLKNFNAYFKRFYTIQILFLLILNFISIIGTYYGVLSLRVFENEIPEIRDFFENPMTYEVFWMASFGYVFLVIGLLNSLFFFTLNRPEYVMYSMVGSLVVNCLVGFICSRVFGLQYAAIGLIVGAMTFAFVTGLIARRFFKHLDYFYYSAY